MRKYDLSFDLAETPRDIRGVEGFLLQHRGSYAQEPYERWVVERCIPEIEQGNRRALLWRQHGNVIGDAIIVPTGTDEAMVKHFRVAPEAWLCGRGLADFLMRQAIAEAVESLKDAGSISRDTDAITLKLDTTLGNPAQTFFERHGFQPVAYGELYEPGKTEVIMERVVPLE